MLQRRTAVITLCVAVAAAASQGSPVARAPLAVDSLLVGDLVRTYSVYVPTQPADTPPLVIVFHPSNGDGSVARRATGYGFDRMADSTGCIVAYPWGFGRHWNGCRRHGPYSANTLDIDDPAFVHALIDTLAQLHSVDRKRVFAVGISNGGHMAYRLGLEEPGLVAGVVAVVASLPAPSNLDCTPTGYPVSVMVLNGTADPINTYNGGSCSYGENGYRGDVLSSEATFEYWSDLADLRGRPTVTWFPDVAVDDSCRVEQRTLSSGAVEVTLVTVHGGGHTLPSKWMQWPEHLGTMNRDVEGVDLIWEFISRRMERR